MRQILFGASLSLAAIEQAGDGVPPSMDTPDRYRSRRPSRVAPAPSPALPASPATPADDDARLVARLRAGDPAAYEEVVRAYGPRLLAVATRFMRNPDDARDALQDGFLSAFRAIRTFTGEARLSTWLHRIVVNAALMKLRSRRRAPETSIEDLLPAFREDGHQAEPAAAWHDDSHEALERDERRALVRRAIDELPESYRTVLILRDIEELDTAETAQLLGITDNAVKIRLHRARQALRTLLDPHFRKASF